MGANIITISRNTKLCFAIFSSRHLVRSVWGTRGEGNALLSYCFVMRNYYIYFQPFHLLVSSGFFFIQVIEDV